MRKMLQIIIVVMSVIALAQAQIVINEIRIDQPSTDNDEYFELFGPPGTSLAGYFYLVLGDPGSGTIEEVEDLSAFFLDGAGYFVAAEASFTLGIADLTTTLSFENSDNVTHMLVQGFTGSNGDDLDTNDDGVLDVMPWTSVEDKIALIEEVNPPTGTEYHYGPPTIGPDGSNVPGHVFRGPDGGNWTIGQFDPIGGDDTPGGNNPLAVELSSFTAEISSYGVLLKWTTESETENLGFALERKQTDSDWQEIASYKTNDALLGQGSTPNATDYEYLDRLVQQGNSYEYRLADIDYNGLVTYHAVREVTIDNNLLPAIANNFSVMAYPNPFNPITTIRYSVPDSESNQDVSVSINIYNISGKLVNSLVNNKQSSGWYEIQWNGTNQNGKNVPAGVYLSRVSIGKEVKTTKLMLLK